MSIDENWTDEDWGNLSDEDWYDIRYALVGQHPRAGKEIKELYYMSWEHSRDGGSEEILKFRGAYFRNSSEDGFEQFPYKALDYEPFVQVPSSASRIDCSELSAEELIERHNFAEIGDGNQIEINGDTYEVKGEKLLKLQGGE